jgi:hypothetical protein
MTEFNPNCELNRFATKGEQARARSIVHRALTAGYSISVCDGEEWTVKRSKDRNEVLNALASTSDDCLRLRNDAGEVIGSVWFIWGNAEDGSELAADYSDNEATRAIVGD